MALVLLNTYNEADNSNVRDYSNSLAHSSSVSSFSTITDTVVGFGLAANLIDASYTIPSITTTASFTYVLKFYMTRGFKGTEYNILNRTGNLRIKRESDNTLSFILQDGTLSPPTINISLDFNKGYTIFITRGQSGFKVYLNDDSIAYGASQGDALNNNTDIAIGDVQSGFVLSELRIYDTVLTEAQRKTLHFTNQGKEIRTISNFKVGDVIRSNRNDFDGVVTARRDGNSFHVVPLTGSIKNKSKLVKIGHRWDEDRQAVILTDKSTGVKTSYINIKNASDLSNNDNVGVKIEREKVESKTIGVKEMILAPEYTVVALPAAADNQGGIVAVSNETSGYTLAFSDGTNWRRVQDRVIVS